MANSTSKLVIGNVGRDPEIRYTSAGKAVADFSLVEEEYIGRNADNTPNIRKTWYKVTAWEETAEKVQAHIQKGQSLALIGRVSADAYVAQDGTAKSNLILTLDKFDSIFIAPPRDNSGAGASSNSGSSTNGGNYGGNFNNQQDLDDIPF